jgi:hypothetical protein
MKTTNKYSYVIIKHNNEYLKTLSVLFSNKYKERAKYAMLTKIVHADGSENIAFIDYSNDLEKLHDRAKGFISWYNYPLGLYKEIQGNILRLN